MAKLVKWLTHWFVAPARVGSIPTLRPIIKKKSLKRLFLFGALVNPKPKFVINECFSIVSDVQK